MKDEFSSSVLRQLSSAMIGFIFDLDGTIVDSMGYYRQVWEELLRENGSTDVVSTYLSRSTRENFKHLLGRELEHDELEGHVNRQAERSRSMMEKHGVRVNDGILELIAGLGERGVRLGVATAAERGNVEWTLSELGIRDAFNAIVTDREVARGKPAPDVYLEAVKRLGVTPQHCAVMEDAPQGVRAAQAAGLRVIAVLSTHSRRELQHADWVVESAADVSAEDVIQFIATTE